MVGMPSRAASPPVQTAGKPVGAALNTVRLLQFAIEHPQPWTATEASRALGLNPSTGFNLVQTLLGEGLFEPAGDGKRYRVGARLNGLAQRLIAQSRDFSAARPLMQALADRFKVTATLWQRRTPTRMELLLVASCNTAVNIQMPIGQRLPVLVGGMGRIMALQGGLSDELRQQVFAQIKWQRPLTLTALLAQARQAQRQGWGLDDGYMNRSVMAVAVPVRPALPAEPVEYVCSATMFRHQYSRVALQDMADALQGVAAQVAAVLQSRG